VVASFDSNRLRDIDRYWCAANYLTIGQIYLRENPLLRQYTALDSHRLRPCGYGAKPRTE